MNKPSSPLGSCNSAQFMVLKEETNVFIFIQQLEMRNGQGQESFYLPYYLLIIKHTV